MDDENQGVCDMVNQLNQEIIDKLIKFKQILVKNNYQINKFIAFGSRVKGTNMPWSDIDICLVSPNVTGDPSSDYVSLRQLSRTIDISIEPHAFTPEDFDREENGFAYEIKQTGVEL